MPSIKRPVLSLQTIYFHDDDRDAARDLGDNLYSHLTRRKDDPLGYGSNIPVLVGVRSDKVDPRRRGSGRAPARAGQ